MFLGAVLNFKESLWLLSLVWYCWRSCPQISFLIAKIKYFFRKHLQGLLNDQALSNSMEDIFRFTFDMNKETVIRTKKRDYLNKCQYPDDWSRLMPDLQRLFCQTSHSRDLTDSIFAVRTPTFVFVNANLTYVFCVKGGFFDLVVVAVLVKMSFKFLKFGQIS